MTLSIRCAMRLTLLCIMASILMASSADFALESRA
jgi:hypothetical protein